jgi:hypothetical protein
LEHIHGKLEAAAGKVVEENLHKFDQSSYASEDYGWA